MSRSVGCPRSDCPNPTGHALDDARDWVNAIDPDDWDEFFNLHDGGKSRGDDVTWLHSAFYRRESRVSSIDSVITWNGSNGSTR